MSTKVEIKSRLTEEILFSAAVNQPIRLALTAALESAVTSGADLTGADLTSIGGNVEEKQCESSDCPVVLYTGEECPVCGR